MEKLERRSSSENKLNIQDSLEFHTKIIGLMGELSEKYPDAYEILGGDAEHWHFHRLALDQSPREVKQLQDALRIVTELLETAKLNPESELRSDLLRQKAHDYHKAMYGI